MSLVYLDIETIPSASAMRMVPDEDYLLKGVGSNWKPETIEAHRERRHALWPTEIAKIAALDWRLGEVVAIGWAVDDGPVETIIGHDEAKLLHATWAALHKVSYKHFVGFHIRGFDLPYLMGRSGALGIPVPFKIDLRRWGGTTIDWAELLGEGLHQTGWTLERYATQFDLPHKPWGKGEQVYGWWQDKNLDAITRHLTADVETVRALHTRFAPAYGLPT